MDSPKFYRDELASMQPTYVTKTPLALGTLFQRHEQAPGDLVDATFSSNLLDTTRRGVPSAVAEMKNDIAIAPKATSGTPLRHPVSGRFVKK
jgi:hypothetical protein